MKRDGHIHSPFCPHGTKDEFEKYVEKAIKLGFSEISFTEHAPLPKSFVDPTPDQDSGMNHASLEKYLLKGKEVQKSFEKDIKINIGLEVDYIEGYENETARFLNTYGPMLDDSILSVHFLKRGSRYFCLDYSPQNFGEMVQVFGSVDYIYEAYYKTLSLSIAAELGAFKPRRIGHITLVHKFQKKYPPDREFRIEVLEILKKIKAAGLELDYNGAGTVKPLCREPYPPDWAVKEAVQQKIPLIYGSDAHSARDLGQGYELLLI